MAAFLSKQGGKGKSRGTYVITASEWRHASLGVCGYEGGEDTGPKRATLEPSKRKHGSALLLKQLIRRWDRLRYVTCSRKARNRHKIRMWKYKGKGTLGKSRCRCEDNIWMNLGRFYENVNKNEAVHSKAEWYAFVNTVKHEVMIVLASGMCFW
jgi:hypothetical protein